MGSFFDSKWHDASFNRYSYSHINEQQIRCLHLKPRGLDTDPRGHLRTHDRSLGGYIALSYEWGEELPSEDNKVLLSYKGYKELTTSLWLFLYDLENCQLDEKIFFVDQISIDQDDLDEKDVQVAVMGSVYREADKIITWLGSEEDDDHAAFELLSRIVEFFGMAFDTYQQDFATLNEFAGSSVAPTELREFGWSLDRSDLKTLRHLEHIVYDTGWTQRLWMVQENVLNKEVWYLRGTRLLDRRSIHILPFCHAMGYLSLPDAIKPHLFHQAWMVVSAWSRIQRTSDTPSLLNLVGSFGSSMQCRDPSDKIFALLSLTGNTLGIVPAYKSNPRQVFADFAKRVIDRTRTLSILEYVSDAHHVSKMEHLAGSTSWPSWLPTFLQPLPASIEGNAAGSTLSDPLGSTALRTLTMKALKLDNIMRVIVSFEDSRTRVGIPEMPILKTLRQLLKEVEGLARAGSLKNCKAKAWRHKLCCTIIGLDVEQDSTVDDDQWENLHIAEEALNHDPEKFTGLPSKEDTEAALMLHSHFGTREQDHFRSISKLEGRSVCLTTAGRLVLAPKDVLPYDEIVAVQGGGPLFILRPKTDNEQERVSRGTAARREAALSGASLMPSGRKIIGPAFMQGAMNAQFFADNAWEAEIRKLVYLVIHGLGFDLPHRLQPRDKFSTLLEKDVVTDSMRDGIKERIEHLIGIMMMTKEELEQAAFLGGADFARSIAPRFGFLTKSDQQDVIRRAVVYGPKDARISVQWREMWWSEIELLSKVGALPEPSWKRRLSRFILD